MSCAQLGRLMRQEKFLCLVTVAALLGLSACGTAPEVARQTYLDKGNELFTQSKYVEAALNYQKSIQKDPQFGQAYYRLGLAELKQNHFREAYRALQRATELMPDDEEAADRLADLCLTAYLSGPNRPLRLREQLAALSDRLLQKHPNSFDGLRLKGYLAMIDGKLPQAIEHFRKANAVRPMDPALVVPLVQSLIENNQARDGEILALQLIEKQKTFGPIYDLLYVQYLATKRFADAEGLLEKKVANNPAAAEFILQLANHYAAFNKRAEITAALQRMLDDPKDFAQARLQVGDFYAARGSFDEAIRQFQEGARTNPQDRLACQKRIASALIGQAKRAEAETLLEAILKDHPKEGECRRMRATLWLESGDAAKIKAATTELEELVQQVSADAGLHFNLGRGYLAQGNAPAGRAQFLETIRCNPDHTAARLALAEISLKANNNGEALKYADEVLSRHSDDTGAMLVRAISLMGMRRYGEARTELQSLVKRRPQFLDAQLQLGLLDIAEKRYREADDVFRRVYQPGQADLRPLMGLAESQIGQNQFDSALNLLSQELKRSPNSAEIRLAFASTAVRAGRYGLALQQYQQLAASAPNSAEIRIRLGEIHDQQGDLGQAIACFQKAAELEPKSPSAHNHLAFALDRAGQKEEAIQSYGRSLALHPDDPVIQNNLAFLLAETRKDLDGAMKLAERAQQKLPDNPGVTDTLGWVYLRKGMRDSAIQVFSNLARRYPSDPTFRYHLGLALLEKGDKIRAIAQLKTALENRPSKVEETKIRELISRIG